MFLLDEHRAAEVVSKLFIHHAYGAIAPLPWQQHAKTGSIGFGADGELPDLNIAPFISNIRTFNESILIDQDLTEVREFLGSSDQVVFVGFHFHKQNLSLLQPEDHMIAGHHRRIVSSVFHRSQSDVEVIQQMLRAMFAANENGDEFRMCTGDCKQLFTDYGLLMTR